MFSSRSKLRVVFGLATAVALIACVGVASAGLKKVPTTATLTFNPPDNFSGEVRVTGSKKCQRDRLVTLYDLGSQGTDAPRFVEAAKSFEDGHYEINVVGGASASYYSVTVSKRVIKKRNLKCQQFVLPATKLP